MSLGLSCGEGRSTDSDMIEFDSLLFLLTVQHYFLGLQSNLEMTNSNSRSRTLDGIAGRVIGLRSHPGPTVLRGVKC